MASSGSDGGIPIPIMRTGRSSSSCKKFANQDFDSLKSQCRGRLFEDPAFPASNRLLVDGNSNYVVSYFGRNLFDAGSVEWLRPQVIKQVIKAAANYLVINL